MAHLKLIFTVLLCSWFVNCQTTTVRPDGKPGKLASPPDYSKTQHFFLGGLVGESVIPVQQICSQRGARQLQSQTTFLNGLAPFAIAFLGVTVMLTGAVGLLANVSSGELSQSSLLTLAGGFVLSTLAPLIYTPKTAKVWCGEENGAQGAINYSENVWGAG